MRAALGQTLSSAAFADAHRAVVPPVQAPAPAPVVAVAGEFTLVGASLTHRLRQHGCAIPMTAGDRFEARQVIGDGANGRVIAVRDRNLDREVAVKFLKAGVPPPVDEVEGFIAEARTTAALEHPNVLPVHEIDVNDRGQIYFTMKRITGQSLGEAIALSAPAARLPAIDTPLRVASIVRSVAHALSYAHHRGIVHQDVKPDNIMLGEFGEVLLVDWGSASRLDDARPRIYGTPLYMSPEQARTERSDARSDVYCLGATLFHALALRVPTWADDADEFWRKKREGIVDEPDEQERRACPAALFAIARKAMAPRPPDRYQRVEELLDDLERFQNGLAVSAHRDSPLEAIARWHRRHARAFWSTVAAVTAIAALTLMLYGERLKERATWGEPVLVETFSDPSWQQRWLVSGGSYEASKAGLESTGELGNSLTYRTKLMGDVAIEFTGLVRPEKLLSDLSFLWDRDIDIDRLGPEMDNGRSGRMYAQVGGQANSFTTIRGEDGHHVSYSAFRLAHDRPYRVRLEVVGTSMRLLVDGRELCHDNEVFPLTGGHVTIYTYSTGKAVSDVRIYERSLPQRVPATAIADTFFQKRQYADAREIYDKIARDQPTTDMGRSSVYKGGLCSLRLGHEDEAQARWQALRGTAWDERLRVDAIGRLIDKGDLARAVSDMAELARSRSEDIRTRAAVAWSAAVLRLSDQVRLGEVPMAALEPFLEQMDGPFAGIPIIGESSARALIVCGRAQEVERRFPRMQRWIVQANSNLGRDDETIKQFGLTAQTVDAFLRTGRHQELLAAIPTSHLVDRYLHEMGRYDELSRLGWATARMAVGRFQEVIDSAGEAPGLKTRAWLFLGHPEGVTSEQERDSLPFLLFVGDGDRALARYGEHQVLGMTARHLAGLQAFIAGDRQRAFALFEPPERMRYNQENFHLSYYVIYPFLRELDGDAGALDRFCGDLDRRGRWIYRQWPWHNAAWLTHRIDDAAYLAQPCPGFAAADLELLRAIQAERSHDAQEALAAYARYLAVPPERRWITRDGIRERFVTWRMEELRRAR
jgi:eukaryotic-like serine/threonine-protein kinase